MSTRGNCGDFLPGQTPYVLSSTTGTSTGWIPTNGQYIILGTVQPVSSPSTGENVQWKCEELSPGDLRNTTGQIQKKCFPCDGQRLNPIPGSFGCIYIDEPTCRTNCSSSPVITQQKIKYKCVITNQTYCDQERSILHTIERSCQPCLPDSLGNYEAGCDYTTLGECQRYCTSSLVRNCPTPKTVLPQEEILTNSKIVNLQQLVFETNQNVQTTQTFKNINVESEYDQIVDSTLAQINLSKNVYNQKYNLLKTNGDNQFTKLVYNNYYKNIFANSVSENVHYFLEFTRSANKPWNEKYIQSLTNNKILISLNKKLLQSFKSIRTQSGEIVPINNFLECVRKHLITGTLDEFDSNYYHSLAEAQKTYNYSVFSEKALSEKTQKLALKNLISNGLKAITESKNLEAINRDIRRQRRLNEDINTRTCACTLESETKELLIPNAGICVTTLEGQNLNIENSPGDGYYLYLNTVDSGCAPFLYDTDVSAALIATPKVRAYSLNLLGESPNITIIGSSTEANNELNSNFNEFTTPQPLYFKLDLSSVSSEPSTNLLVENITTKFSLLTDEDEINEHTDNNGIATSKVYIDYRDPLYRYIKDSGSLTLKQKDINIRQFGISRESNQLILTRNIPFALIIIPVQGSKFNPFNGRSKISKLENVIERTLSFSPSLEMISDVDNKSPLKQVRLFSIDKEKIGIVEPRDIEGWTYRYDSSLDSFTKTFYNKSINSYDSNYSEVSSYGISYLVKDVIDYTISSYNPTELFWFDLFRRMPLFKFGELAYDMDDQIMSKLSNGFRANLKIKNLLDVPNAKDLLLADDSKTIIKITDRNATTS